MLRERWKEDCRRDKPGQGGRAVRPALGGYVPACFDRDGLCIASTRAVATIMYFISLFDDKRCILKHETIQGRAICYLYRS